MRRDWLGGYRGRSGCARAIAIFKSFSRAFLVYFVAIFFVLVEAMKFVVSIVIRQTTFLFEYFLRQMALHESTVTYVFHFLASVVIGFIIYNYSKL